MTRKNLNTRLTLEALKAAALVTFRNAEELLADAELLHYHQRFPRAIFLTCVGIEELGKARLAFELYSIKREFRSESEVKDFWRFWNDHTSKTAHGEGYLALDPNIMERHVSDSLPAGYSSWHEFEKKKKDFYIELSKNRVKMKEASLYVDLIRGAGQSQAVGFSLPSVPLKKEHSERFIRGFREKIKELEPEFQKLGWLNVPYYPPDEYEEHMLYNAMNWLE